MLLHANVFLGWVYHSAVPAGPLEGEIQVLAGLVKSSQSVGSLLRTPVWQSCQEKKLAKCLFGDFTSLGKYIQLLLMKCFCILFLNLRIAVSHYSDVRFAGQC